jgi:hypothetical protein
MESYGGHAGYMFPDLEDDGGVPSAVSTNRYKDIYIGEAKITSVKRNGKYGISVHGNAQPDARPVFNMGENVLTEGIAVLVLSYNGEAWILGKLRVTKDEEPDDGVPTTDTSPVVGNKGDATLRPHTTDDENLTPEITVTAGGVAKMKATGATNITLHPHGERIIQRSQSLLAFTDGYRIESGRKSGKAGGVNTDTQTTQTYVTKAGPARTEIVVKNGKSVGSVHEFSVRNVATAAGVTTGLKTFKYSISDSGSWDIDNASSINLGNFATEPLVLGTQYTNLQRALVLDQTVMNAANVAAMSTLTPLLTTAYTLTLALPFTSIGNFFGLMILYPALIAMSAAFSALYTASTANLTAQQLLYLTPYPPFKELVLSDWISTQKTAPFPGVVVE